MADQLHFVGGDNYILDDLSGFKIRAFQARIIPGGITGGLAVSPLRWEPQQPQDFVTGVRDDQTPNLSRPRQQNQFVIVGTYVVAPSARGTTEITVDSSVGFAPGSTIILMLDSGVNFQTNISSMVGNVWTLGEALPATVGTMFGDPIENSILLLTNEPTTGLFILDSATQGILNVNVLG